MYFLYHWLPNNRLGVPWRSWQQCACVAINKVCCDRFILDMDKQEVSKWIRGCLLALHQHLNGPMHAWLFNNNRIMGYSRVIILINTVAC